MAFIKKKSNAFNTQMKVIRISNNAWSCFANKTCVLTLALRNTNLMSALLLNGPKVRHDCYNEECYGCWLKT